MLFDFWNAPESCRPIRNRSLKLETLETREVPSTNPISGLDEPTPPVIVLPADGYGTPLVQVGAIDSPDLYGLAANDESPLLELWNESNYLISMMPPTAIESPAVPTQGYYDLTATLVINQSERPVPSTGPPVVFVPLEPNRPRTVPLRPIRTPSDDPFSSDASSSDLNVRDTPTTDLLRLLQRLDSNIGIDPFERDPRTGRINSLRVFELPARRPVALVPYDSNEGPIRTTADPDLFNWYAFPQGPRIVYYHNPVSPPLQSEFGNRDLSVGEGFRILQNLSENKPAFEGIGRRGGVTNVYFVTEGNPTTTGARAPDPIKLNVTIRKDTPTKTLTTAEAEAIYRQVEQREGERVWQELVEADKAKQLKSQLANWELQNELNRSRGIDVSGRMPPAGNYLPPVEGDPKYAKLLEAKAIALKSLTWNEISRLYAKAGEVIIIDLKDSFLSETYKGETREFRNGKIAIVPEGLKGAVEVTGGVDALIPQLQKYGNAQITDPAALEAMLKAARAHEIAAGRSLAQAAQVRAAFKWGGRVFFVVGATLDGIRIYEAEDKSRVTAKVIGGWAGALIFAEAFAIAWTPADVAGPVAWSGHGAGTLVAGGIGYYVGDSIAETIYDYIVTSSSKK